MIIKLKCVSNIDYAGGVSEYLTVGKVYSGSKIDNLVYSEGDNGEKLLIFPKCCAHGKWEVVN